jgi:hypothetical protein
VKQSFNMRILCKILALLFRHVGNVDLAITSIYRKPRTPLKEQDISVPSGLSKILATHVLFSEGYRYSAITVTMNSSYLCPLGADDRFGPAVVGCRDDFDFTLLFEQSMLSLGPSVVLLIVSFPRIIQLYRCCMKTVTTPLRICKPVSVVWYDIKGSSSR